MIARSLSKSLIFVLFFAAALAAQTTGPNLVANSMLATDPGGSNRPQAWSNNVCGNSQATFTYPVAGWNNSTNGAQVAITLYTSCDAKWTPPQISITGGQQYQLTDHYMSNEPSLFELQYLLSNGTNSWPTIATLPASPNYTTGTATFTAPANAVAVIPYHAIAQYGAILTVSDMELHAINPTPLSAGMVSINFDDCDEDGYTNGMPIVNAAGFKISEFVVTGYTLGQYPAYCSVVQVQQAHQQGHEVVAHTRTHQSLSTLTYAQQQSEITGSKQDLIQSFGITPTTFAYPFGDYGQEATSNPDAMINQVLTLVQQTGYTGARSTLDGDAFDESANTPQTNPFLLVRMDLNDTTTLAAVENAIDAAIANKQWLIFELHHINTNTDTSTNGSPYVITPSFFQSIVNYIVQTKVAVVTNAQGLAMISK